MRLDEPTAQQPRLEWAAIALITLVGAGLRTWSLGGLGLTHYDEGIYALVASWSLNPRGIASLDPILVSYAPPGYPILGGLATAFLGRSDLALILVSLIAGIATTPVVAWLARRTFGPGAGYASAVFCAFSGPAIAFSRMGLTDASSLLAWLLALAAGSRFLERPGLVRALIMGLAVGLAQEFKYNGWLTGGIVIGTALVGTFRHPEEGSSAWIVRTFGWGTLAAGIAWLVVWPWYTFVEAHGGYSALLRHQRNYLGGWNSWWPNLSTQADQAVALSGGLGLALPAVALAALTPWVGRNPGWWSSMSPRDRIRQVIAALVVSSLGGFLGDKPYALGLIASPWLILRPDPARRLVGVWFLILGVSSPFYHPYARLWLPLEACHWILIGWLVAEGSGLSRVSELAEIRGPGRHFRARWLASLVLGLGGLAGWISIKASHQRGATSQPDLLATTDSLRRAAGQVAALLPDDVQGLRTLVRPSLTFYLAGKVSLAPMAGSEGLARPSGPNVWALIDSALLRSELGRGTEVSSRALLDRLAVHWEIVEEIPTVLGLPTLLDIDPEAAHRPNADRSCRLWLLRPRRSGVKK